MELQKGFPHIQEELKEPYKDLIEVEQNQDHPRRTMNQFKKMIKRREAQSMRIQYLGNNKDIWDVDYLSTSDEEDNDSDPEEEDNQDG